MKKISKKITALLMSLSMITAYCVLPQPIFAEESLNNSVKVSLMESEKKYICDFSQLVKDGGNTVYGTTADIIKLDDYTTANLTYEGTYVSADGKVYLMGANNGKGSYTKGSYLEFTAPNAGTINYTGSYANYYVDGIYTGYTDSAEIELKAGQKFQIGERVNERSYVISLSFTPTALPTPDPSLTLGYTEGEYNGMQYRMSIPSEQGEYPLVLFLHSSSQNGTDNVNQMIQAQYFFEHLKNECVLLAPQTSSDWSKETVSGLIDSIPNVDTDKIYIIGQEEGADATINIAAQTPNKIAGVINISPTYILTEEQVNALSNANTAVYTFAEYANSETARTNVNAIQLSKMTDVMYTEYPYAEENITKTAAQTSGIYDWLIKQSLTDNIEEKTKTRVVDLAIFMGQSNMAGRGEYADAQKVGVGHGFEYHSVTKPGVISTAEEPFGKYENNSTINDNSGSGVDRRSGDMVSAFMESYYQVAGVPLVGVQCSRGGTESKWWNTDTQITEVIMRYNEAKSYLEANGYTIGKRFMVWCQGCSDADNSRSIESYKENTESIYNKMKSGTTLTDMFMVRIGHCKTSGAAAIDTEKDARYKEINLAQKALADETEGITAVASFYTDEYAAQMRDQYHYHQSAYNSIGAVAGNNTAYTLYNTGSWTEYPEPEEQPSETPVPTEGLFEITSSDKSIDVSTLKMYDSNSYVMYKPNGSSEVVTTSNGKIENTTGGSVTVVPEYKFEFTNQTNPTDKNIAGYTKVGQGSYTEEKGYGLTADDYKISTNGCYAKDSPIKVDLASGYYDITVYRIGGARADIYSNGRLIANNTTSATAQNRGGATALMEISEVKMYDGSADIAFGNLSGTNERIASVKIVRVPEKYRKPVIWIAGDSEASNYYPFDSDGDDLDSDKIMITGFGQQLSKLMSDKYVISNYGQPSATVKTWYDECFDSVNELMQSGDTILIDFGINEVASSSNRLTIDEMKTQMKTIIDAAKAKNVTPILVSPVYNGKYQGKAYFTYNSSTKTNSMYAFAEENGIECIDLNKWTQLYANQAVAETGDTNWIANNYHVSDNLHLTQYSAVLAASFIAAEMSDMGYDTNDFEDVYEDISAVETGNVRGSATGEKRIYSVEAAKTFINDGLILKPSNTTPTEEPTREPISEKVRVNYEAEKKQLALTTDDTQLNSAVVMETAYNGDGTMDTVKIHPVTFNNKSATVADIEITENEKVFVWDSIQSMKPLSEVYKTSAISQPTPTPITTTDEPIEILYEQNFESYSEQSGTKTNIADGWRSNAGKASVKTDSTKGINRYMAITGANASRSGYKEIDSISENFVFEADLKTVKRTDRVSELQLVESYSGSIYENHGIDSSKNGKYVFTMDRPKNENRYVINNGISDSGLGMESYNQPTVSTKEISSDNWIHVKVVGNFDTGKVVSYITSLDGKTEYYHGMSDMSEGIKSFKCIHLLGPVKDVDTSIDNIKIYKARKADLEPKYHKVTMTCKAYTFNQYVLDGESVVNIPNVSTYGDSFVGWKIGDKLYTTEQLKTLSINEDSEIIGEVSSEYIEGMKTAEFNTFPIGSELVMGEDENTAKSNPISLTITGEQGTSLVINPDSRVTDFNVEWTFDGFRTLDGRPTGESGNNYCEGYGKVNMTAEHNTSVDFTMKKTAANYYGRVTAKITYNGKEITVSKPLILLADKSNTGLFPKAGYTSDYNKYEDSLIGYRGKLNDLILGGWQSYGSDASYMDLKSDALGKYLSLSRAASGNSSAIYNTIGNISGQTIFEQDIRFGINGSISYVGGGTMTEPLSTAFSFTKTGTNFSFNGKNIYNQAESDTWYHVVINADPTSKLCFAKVYNIAEDYSEELPIAVSDTVSFESKYTDGSAYRVSPERISGGSIDLNNIKVYTSEIDSNTINITAPTTANIPESGNSKISLSVAAKTVVGDSAIGLAEWRIDDEFAEGVTIVSTGDRSAELSISNNAVSGDLPVRVTIGDKSKTITIKLLGTKDNVAFTEAPKGIQLGALGTYKFTAVVRNGQAEDVTDRRIAYSITDELGNNLNPTGISIMSDGIMTVSADTEPQTLYVKAQSVDESNNEISKTVKVTLYGLKFQFGTGATANGYTKVSANTVYSDGLGFGIDGGTENTDAMTGGVFKVKLEKGKVYNVTAAYEGSITCERIDSSLTGFVRSMTESGTDTFKTAIFGDDIMDIKIDGALKSISIAAVEKETADKPDWWTIGDSTVQQNGSWGYVLEGKNLSNYPELAREINAFHNSGRAGRQHKSYYSEGLLNDVLCSMNTGDVVSISGMGTNDSTSNLEQFKEYDKAYINAIIDMGGYVILGSYTPSGNYGETAGKVYDADNMTFKGMRTNAYDRAIRELYSENTENKMVLGFLDIGKIADDKMTADVKSAYDDAINSGVDEATARTAANNRAAELMSWWRDYNHYSADFSNYILSDLTKIATGLIAKK